MTGSLWGNSFAKRLVFPVSILLVQLCAYSQTLEEKKHDLIGDHQRRELNQRIVESKDIFGYKSCFIENIGQYNTDHADNEDVGKIKFGFHGFNMPILFTDEGIIFLQSIHKLHKEKAELTKPDNKNDGDIDGDKESTSVITMKWGNANPHPEIITSGKKPTYFTFGTLAGKAMGYNKITYKNLYPGIDITYLLQQNDTPGFEYTITVHPGADLSKVEMIYKGDVKTLNARKNAGITFANDNSGFNESLLSAYYDNEIDSKISIEYKITKKTVRFISKKKLDPNKTLIIDPFITSTNNLTGLNAGKAMDVDFDFAGNIFVSGGGDGTTNHMLAKYDANGILQWTFSGILTAPSWEFGTYYGGWVVEKNTGKVYLGQGFEYVNGFSVIRLNPAGIYDNYITDANPNFREDWKMYWMCNNGSPQILIAGGGTNANTNFGVCTPPSTTISSLNITGIPYTGADGWAQDISDLVIDPVTNDMYTIYGSLYGTPSLSNKIFKNASPYSAASIAWSLYSGFISIQEIANRPYLSGSDIDNSSNVLAVNSSYFFYWDGKNLKAFDKGTGAPVGSPLTVAANKNLMSGGIVADECNNIFVGSTNGIIKVYKFNGSIFDDAADPDIIIAGNANSSVYDLSFNESQRMLYASGDDFLAAFDISSYACPVTTYALNIISNCAAGTAAASISPAPQSGSTVTYDLLIGNSQIATNVTGVFTGLSAGINYTVKAYINQVCSGSVTIKDFVLPGPIVTLAKTDATCGAASGSITAAGSGGAGPYNYTINGSPYRASGSFTNLAAGLYVISVKDGGGCISKDSIIIENTNGPSITFTKSDATCSNNNGLITAKGSGGTPPLQYSIDGTSYQNSNFFPGLAAGNYSLFVKDGGGCINVASVSIGNFPSPQLSATPASTTCDKNNGIIYAFATGGTGTLEYSINGNIFQPGTIFYNVAPGSYSLSVKDQNGCLQAVEVTVMSSPGPTISAFTTPATCNNVNGSITATGSGDATPLQYSIDGINFQGSNIFTGLGVGNYTITVKDANGCTNSTVATISSSGGPVVAATSTTSSCSANDGTITVSATGAAPLQYSIDGITFQSSAVFTGVAAGNYIVFVSDAGGCIATTSVTVENTAGPQVTAIATPASCTSNNGQIIATGTGGTSPLQYSIDGITFQTGNVFSNLAEGQYNITVKDVNGCEQTAAVDVQNASGLSLNASSISTSCAGNNGSITATATGGKAPLQYSINGTLFQASNIFNSLTAGIYTVTVKDANGCSASQSITVLTSSSVVINVTSTNANCNSGNGIITVTASGGTAPYEFSINGTIFQNSGLFINVAPGVYPVTVRDSLGCINSISDTILNFGSGPGPTLVIESVHNSYCGKNNGSIGVSGPDGGGSYTFSIDGINFQTDDSFEDLPPGVYIVTIKDSNGCTSSKIVTILNVGEPTITDTTTAAVCNQSNGTITATASNGKPPYQFSINGGPYQSTGIFGGLAAGSYTISVIDTENCAAVTIVNVYNSGGPSLTVSEVDAKCDGNNGVITATATGGIPPLLFNLNGGPYQSSGMFNGLTAGSYNIEVLDSTGCVAGDSVVISSAGSPIITPTITNASCNNNNGNAVINVSGASPPFKYSIDGTIFQNTNTFSNLSPGNYTVTVLDSSGCFNTLSFDISPTAIPDITAYTIAARCSENDGKLIASGSNGSLPYTFSIDGVVYQSSDTFVNLLSGFYTVRIKDADGCINTSGVTVDNISDLQLSLSSVPTTCGNSNGVIITSVTGGSGIYTYSIDGINFTSQNIFTSLPAGAYNITVRDGNGCLQIRPIVVENISGVQQITSTVTNSTCSNNNGAISIAATGGVGPLQYSIDGTTFQNTNIFNGLSAATYIVTVKDADGCTINDTANIADLSSPTISSSSSQTTCNQTDGSIIATATGGTAPLQYSIDGITFQASNVFTGLAAGPYTVTVKDATGVSIQQRCKSMLPAALQLALRKSTPPAAPRTVP